MVLALLSLNVKSTKSEQMMMMMMMMMMIMMKWTSIFMRHALLLIMNFVVDDCQSSCGFTTLTKL